MCRHVTKNPFAEDSTVFSSNFTPTLTSFLVLCYCGVCCCACLCACACTRVCVCVWGGVCVCVWGGCVCVCVWGGVCVCGGGGGGCAGVCVCVCGGVRGCVCVCVLFVCTFQCCLCVGAVHVRTVENVRVRNLVVSSARVLHSTLELIVKKVSLIDPFNQSIFSIAHVSTVHTAFALCFVFAAFILGYLHVRCIPPILYIPET